MINVFELYGSWQGRIGRVVHVVAFGVLMVVSLILQFILGTFMDEGANPETIVGLITLYPSWVLSVKRAHDIGKSSWWVLGWFAMALAAAVCVGIGAVFFPLLLVGGPLAFVAAWNLIIKLFLYQGEIGANKFGPPSRVAANLLNDDSDLDRPTAQSNARMAAMSAAIQAHNAPRPPRNQTPNKPRPQGFGRRTVA